MRVVRDTPRRPDPGFAELYAGLPDAIDLEPWLGWCRSAQPPVLYLGIGAGRLAVPLARAGVRLIGLDAHAGMLRLLTGREPRLPLVRALAQGPPFGAAFDLVIAPSNLLARQPLLRAAAALLRPGGRLGMELTNPHWLLAVRRSDVRVAIRGPRTVALEVDYPGGFTQVARERPLWPERAERRLSQAGLRLEQMHGSEDPLAESPSYWVLASKRLRRAQTPST